MLLLLYLIFIVLFGCGRILFSTHCFSPLLILLGDIFSTYLYHLISAFIMRQIPLGMKHKRDLDTSKMATKVYWCQSLELAQLSCQLLLCSFQFSEFFVDEVHEGCSLQGDTQLFTQGLIYSCGSKPKQQQPSAMRKNRAYP